MHIRLAAVADKEKTVSPLQFFCFLCKKYFTKRIKYIIIIKKEGSESFMKSNQNTFSQNNYDTKDVTLSNSQVMMKGGLYSLIFVLALGFSYRFLLMDRAVQLDISGIRFPILFLAIIFIVTIIHELLHGIGWAFVSRKGWNTIKFNINAMMPSCSCKAALEKNQYLLGVLAPFTVLGIGSIIFLLAYPGTISLLTAITVFVGTGGDLVIALNVLKEKTNTLISDHPTKAGYIAYIK